MPSTKRILVVDYNPIWSDQFLKLKSVFTELLGSFDISIEHVGSTSVTGLAAKPIIDIDIISKCEENNKGIIELLESIGYIHQGDLGIAGREAFKIRDSFVPFTQLENEQIDHHLYLCVKENISLENHLKFRNYLRVHPEAVEEYTAIKRDLAKRFPNDIDSYVEGKTAFITNVLAKCGFKSSHLKEIAAQNKK